MFLRLTKKISFTKPYAPRYFETILREDGFEPYWRLMKGNLVARGSGFVFFRKSYWKDLLCSAVGFVTHIKGWHVLSKGQMRSLVLALKVFATEIVETHFRADMTRGTPGPAPPAPRQPSVVRSVPSGDKLPQRDREVSSGVEETSVVSSSSAPVRRETRSPVIPAPIQRSLDDRVAFAQNVCRLCLHTFGDPMRTSKHRGIFNDLTVYCQYCSICHGTREGIYRLGIWRPDSTVVPPNLSTIRNLNLY